MKKRWQTVLLKAGLTDADPSLFVELETLYSETHRKYHNMQHVVDCLDHLDRHPIPETDPVLLELAIWFHDAIYSPLRGDNEKASADLAVKRLGEIGAEGDHVEIVHDLILATTHREEPTTPNQVLLIDIDLAILGSDRERFEGYEIAIRQEYRLVPGLLYRRKRREILQGFLDRPKIFRTQTFFDLYEDAARENLRWAIDRL